METPSSTRRITRSQTLAASGNSNNNNIPTSKKVEGTENGISKSRQRNGNQQDRSALIDITNDSPIVGLAMGSLETPSSNFSKKRISSQSTKNSDTTPGSGEALLRGQVKTLLQKVEEEAELSKFRLNNNVNGHFLHLKGLVNSPMGLLAPTPNNTPQVSNLSVNESAEKKNGLASVTSSPVQEHITISPMVTEIFDGQKKQESVESEKSLITRSLLYDFTDKSEDSYESSDCTSELTYQGGSAGSKVKSTDDDDASIWSIQVNASTRDEEEDDVEDEVDTEEDDDYYEGVGDEEEYGDDGLLDDLCEGLSKISVDGIKFTGKHTRFVYNSDDEIEGEEDCGDASADSPGVLRLKGLPTPKGKHLRFPIED